MSPGAARAARWRGDLAVALLALAALAAWELSGLDLTLARQWGDASGFAWRDHVLTAGVLHQGGRWLAGLVLVLLAWDAWRPFVPGPTRARRAFSFVVVLAAMIVVPLHKRISLTSCPWSLREFGGVADYVPHWLPGVPDGGPGGCFPSGHAVAAFAFFGVYLLWRDHRPAFARAALAAVLAAGALYSSAQMARGAHFLSHSLWTAWLCWVLTAAAFAGADARGRARGAQPLAG